MDIVDRTLKLWRQTPFVYGETDCMLSIGNYIVARGGEDHTHHFRGRYDTQEGAQAAMAEWGGVHTLIDLTGARRIDGEPERGDVVAILCDPAEDDLIAGLSTGGMVAARLERGVIEVQTRFVHIRGVWRCPQ